MTLLIACLLIYNYNMPWWWYIVAVVIWGVHLLSTENKALVELFS
jgi:hypothetical protein